MKKLVLIDLDRTIIDGTYQIIDKNIFSVFKDAEKSMLIGINSDTPIISLRQWRDYFGINRTNPLVAERGAILEVQGEQHFISKARFASFKQDVIYSIHKNIPEAKIVLGDVTKMLIEKQKFSACSNVVMINDYRECSFSCYFRIIGEFGNLVINHNWSERVLQIINNVALPLHSDKPNYDSAYGILIVHAVDVNKAFGAKFLMNKYYPDYKLFMIGDSMSDYLEEIAVHCAVNNAEDEFKKQSSFIAKSKYTSGVIECIDWIKAFV